jgi:hypothetical protein
MSRNVARQARGATAYRLSETGPRRKGVSFASVSNQTLSPVFIPSEVLDTQSSTRTGVTSVAWTHASASGESLYTSNSECHSGHTWHRDPNHLTLRRDAIQFYDERGKVNWVQTRINHPDGHPVEIGYVKGMVYEGHRDRQSLVLVLATVPLSVRRVSIGARVLQVKWKPGRLEQALSDMREMVGDRIDIGDFGDEVCDYAKDYLNPQKVHQLVSNVGGSPPAIPPTTYYNLQPIERYSTRARIGLIENRTYLKSSHFVSSSVEEPTYDAEHDLRSPVESFGDRTYEASDRSSIETAASGRQSALPAVRPGQDMCVIERHAQDYHDTRGKVTWIFSPLHQGSEQNWAFGYIKGMHYRDSDTWVLMLTALKFPIPTYVLTSSQTAAGDTVSTPQRNYHVLLEIDGKTPGNPIARLENRVAELKEDLLGLDGAKIKSIARSSLRDRVDRLWKSLSGRVPELQKGVELGPQRKGERVWKLE